MGARRIVAAGLMAVIGGVGVGSAGLAAFAVEGSATAPATAVSGTQTGAATTRRNPLAGLTTQQRRERSAAINAARREAIVKDIEDTRKRLMVKALSGHTDGVYAVAFSPDGQILASGSGDKTIKLWEVATGKVLKTLEGHTMLVTAVAFSPDGKHLVSGGFDRQLIVWDVATGEVESISKQPCYPYHVAFLPDNAYFVSGCAEHLRLWKVGEAAQVQVMTANENIDCLAVTKEGAVVTGDRGGTVVEWDTNTGEALMKKSRPKQDNGGGDSISSVAMFKNGDVLVVGGLCAWRWKLATGEMEQLTQFEADWAVPVEEEQVVMGMSRTHVSVKGLEELMGVEELVVPAEKAEAAVAAGGRPRGPFPNLVDALHGMAVSPAGDLVAIGRGGKFDENNAWVSCGPRDVEIFSVKEIVNDARARMAKESEQLAQVRKAYEAKNGVGTTRPQLLPPGRSVRGPAAKGWE